MESRRGNASLPERMAAKGELTEWPKVTVLKTVEVVSTSVGSNPTLSAL